MVLLVFGRCPCLCGTSEWVGTVKAGDLLGRHTEIKSWWRTKDTCFSKTQHYMDEEYTVIFLLHAFHYLSHKWKTRLIGGLFWFVFALLCWLCNYLFCIAFYVELGLVLDQGFIFCRLVLGVIVSFLFLCFWVSIWYQGQGVVNFFI